MWMVEVCLCLGLWMVALWCVVVCVDLLRWVWVGVAEAAGACPDWIEVVVDVEAFELAYAWWVVVGWSVEEVWG